MTSSGPKMVTNGLVLHLDVANQRSYSQTETVIKDLTENQRVGSFENATFSSEYRGVLDFNGTTAYMVSNNTGLGGHFSGTSESHFTWVYPRSEGVIVTELGQPVINVGWHATNIAINSSGQFLFSTWHKSLTNYISSSAYSFNQWYHVGWTYNGTTMFGYVNGVLVGSVALTRTVPWLNNVYQDLFYGVMAPDNTIIPTGPSVAGDGLFAIFSVWNRALSTDEVLRNFNVFKNRFGII